MPLDVFNANLCILKMYLQFLGIVYVQKYLFNEWLDLNKKEYLTSETQIDSTL